jgi:hypothetical protein
LRFADLVVGHDEDAVHGPPSDGKHELPDASRGERVRGDASRLGVDRASRLERPGQSRSVLGLDADARFSRAPGPDSNGWCGAACF